MESALDHLLIDGIAHNQAFLAALMEHPRWREGRLSTRFVAEEFPDGFAAVRPSAAARDRLAIVTLAIAVARAARLKAISGRLDGDEATRRDWVVRVGDEQVPLKVDALATNSPVRFDVLLPGANQPLSVASAWRPGDPLWVGTIGQAEFTVQVRRAVAGVRLTWRGVDVVARTMTPEVAALDALMPAEKDSDAAKVLRCPMPGLVVSILVEAGQAVSAGTPLAVVEAMKMENILRAERDATVAAVKVSPGDVLAVDAVIMEFAADD